VDHQWPPGRDWELPVKTSEKLGGRELGGNSGKGVWEIQGG